jgi:2-keto-3-deoxy-L-rhamnonate aldolase RhmA
MASRASQKHLAFGALFVAVGVDTSLLGRAADDLVSEQYAKVRVRDFEDRGRGHS